MSQQAVNPTQAAFGFSPGTAAAKPRTFAHYARLLSILTLVSRFLGLAREAVVARYFGAGLVATAFSVAFRVPNLFRKLLGEGALSSAFIPLYTQALKTGDEAAANEFAAASVNLLISILLALTVLGEIALAILSWFVPMSLGNMLIVRFTQIMLPYLVLICGTAFLGGILQVHKRFALPALAPVLLNIIHIAVVIIGARLLMLSRANDDLLARQIILGYWLAAFVLAAGVLQIAMLVPSLYAVGFRFRWVGNFWTSAVKKMLRLSIPVAMSAGVLQLSVVLDTAITLWLTRSLERPDAILHLPFASAHYPLALGAVARLNWAQLLYQFPLGVFAISVATAIFPNLSSDAMDRDREKFRRVLRQGILFTLLEGIPASAGLILVRYPIIRLWLQHGQFTSADTHLVAMSTMFYAAAIWAFSLQQILNRAYYSLHDTMTPLVLSIITIAVNTVVEIPLCFTSLGEAGMAVGTLASFAIQAIVMLFLLDRRVGGLGLASIASRVIRMLIATALMYLACLAIQRLAIYPHGQGNIASLMQIISLTCVGGAVYFAACWIMGLFSPSEPAAAN